MGGVQIALLQLPLFHDDVQHKGSSDVIRVVISVGTNRDTNAYVEYGTLFPADSTENSKSAIHNTLTDSTDNNPVTISVTGASLVLKGYISGYKWNFTPTQAGTLYDAETGTVVATLSANQTYQYTGTMTARNCVNYYFK